MKLGTLLLALSTLLAIQLSILTLMGSQSGRKKQLSDVWKRRADLRTEAAGDYGSLNLADIESKHTRPYLLVFFTIHHSCHRWPYLCAWV